MADAAVSGLVKEGVSGVCGVAWNLLPDAVLALDAVATQVAPLDACLPALDPCHLGDLGQGSSLGSGSTARPCGHGGSGGLVGYSAALWGRWKGDG